MKKAMIAMSGGVDSSVAALIIKNQGYEIAGMTLSLAPDADESAQSDAAKVAEGLGAPFYLFDYKEDFKNEVIKRFVNAYENGETPNPCVYCNKYIKFARVLEKAESLGYDCIVTGHYAIIDKDEKTGRYLLKKGKDPKKDQSYMLYALSQETLSKTLFPLGGMTKEEVRKIAAENGLVNADRGDSQDICFIPDGDYAKFLQHMGAACPAGNFVGTSGEIYGRHKGIIHYTVGQRKGLGLSFPQPMFVKKIDKAKNEVMLCKSEELFSDTLIANRVNLISVEDITEPMCIKAKIRYHHTEAWATVRKIGDDEIMVIFDTPQRAITKGQAVVLYDGDIVVGGGIITEV